MPQAEQDLLASFKGKLFGEWGGGVVDWQKERTHKKALFPPEMRGSAVFRVV